MKPELEAGLEYFNEVWKRAAPAVARREDGELNVLRGFINAERSAVEFYSALRLKSRETERIARDERRHLRELQAEHYLLCGDSLPPSGSCPLLRGGLSDLRQACLTEREAAQSYETAASECESPALRELYLSHARDEAEHAELLRKLLLRSI